MQSSQEQKTQTNSSDSESKKQVARGLFPRLSLKKVAELAQAVLDLGQGEPVRRLKVFDQLKKAPESGPSRMLVSVSLLYGLTSGGYQAERLEITDLGKSFVTATSSRKIHELAFNILFQNSIFSGFMNHWRDKGMPSDDIAEDWLVREQKLSVSDAKACWAVIKENIGDYSLTQVSSGKLVIVSSEVALESMVDQEVSIKVDSGEEKILQQTLPYEDKKMDVQAPKQFGSQIVENDYKYGRARLILPAQMTTKELVKIKTLIDSMVTEVEEEAK